MIINKETDYALRILRALLDGKKHTAVDIAADEMIPQSFAYQILRKLSKAGFIRVSRGQDGGCELNCNLSDVSLYELTAAVNGVCHVASCTEDGYSCPWRQSNGVCLIHNQLSGIQKRLDAELKSVSLQQLMNG
ncbi:MAG: Rrf2 family transcriptional regulator [Oscillospiraceae bacterium]|nr:Rrf2 family transcriptional regulator [Oscillospiraceae bacterium]